MKDVIVVSGIPRCGSSLIMRMLHVGGLPVIIDENNFVSYEYYQTERFSSIGNSDWLKPGHAIKILDIHRKKLPADKEYKIIYLLRDPLQQAKSQIKLMHETGIFLQGSQPHKKIKKSIEIDNIKASLYYQKFAHIKISFEDLISDTKNVCQKLQLFIGPIDEHLHFLDLQAMENIVVKRSVSCMPDMSIEIERIKEINNIANYKD